MLTRNIEYANSFILQLPYSLISQVISNKNYSLLLIFLAYLYNCNKNLDK